MWKLRAHGLRVLPGASERDRPGHSNVVPALHTFSSEEPTDERQARNSRNAGESGVSTVCDLGDWEVRLSWSLLLYISDSFVCIRGIHDFKFVAP